MKKAHYIIFIIIVVSTCLAVVYGGWRFKRWFNWKFGEGPKIERRIDQMEIRIEVLEQRGDS